MAKVQGFVGKCWRWVEEFGRRRLLFYVWAKGRSRWY